MAGPTHGKDWTANLFNIFKRGQQTYNSTDLGLPILMVRKDALTALSSTDNEWMLVQGDGLGNLRTVLGAGEDSFTGRVDSSTAAVAILAAPGAGFRIEVSHLTVQNSTGTPVACNVALLSNTDDKWVLELSTGVAFEASAVFSPTLKLTENEAMNIQCSVANTGIRYNIQSDVYPV